MNINTENIEEQVISLRKRGLGYKLIGKRLGITRDKARGYCIKNNLSSEIISIELGQSQCKECGKEFKVKSSNQKFCSKECSYKSKVTDRFCVVCNQLIETRSNKYCSDQCRDKIYNSKPKNPKPKERMIYSKHCVNCGQHFESFSHSSKYCSKECTYKEKVCVGCGKEFKTTHSNDKDYCNHKCFRETKKKKHSDFVSELFKAHDGYIVPLELYKGSDDYMKCKCLKCGYEMTKISRMYIGSYANGCKHCKKVSKGEETISRWLDSKGIDYKRQYTDEDVKYLNTLLYDFAIFSNGELKWLIEYDGIQHFKPIDAWGGEENLQDTIVKDEIKNNYADEIGVPLLRISYKEKNDIDKILSKTLSALA